MYDTASTEHKKLYIAYIEDNPIMRIHTKEKLNKKLFNFENHKYKFICHAFENPTDFKKSGVDAAKYDIFLSDILMNNGHDLADSELKKLQLEDVQKEHPTYFFIKQLRHLYPEAVIIMHSSLNSNDGLVQK